MRNFMTCDHVIVAIRAAIYVEAEKSQTVHHDRKSHGVSLNLSPHTKTYIFSDGITIDVEQNMLVYLPKGSSYTVHTKVTGDNYAINFDVTENANFAPFAFRVKNLSGYIRRFKDSEKLWRQKKTAYQFSCKALLYEILALLQSEYYAKYMQQDTVMLISPAVEYIHQHYPEDLIHISEMADLCGISEDYFRKLFKYIYGISPIKYINNLKISRAKELLSTNLYTIAQVSELSGFTDTSYFSREFKKATGVCPLKYL